MDAVYVGTNVLMHWTVRWVGGWLLLMGKVLC